MISVGTLPAVHLAKNSEARRFFQKFKDDEVLTARVISRKGPKGHPQSQVRLLINGKPVTVKAAMDVSVGQEIRLALTHEKNGISLKFLTAGASQEPGDSFSRTRFSASPDSSEKYSLSSEPLERQQLTKQGFASVGKWASALSRGLLSSGFHSAKPVLLRMVSGNGETLLQSLLAPGKKSGIADAQVLNHPDADGLAKILVKGQEVTVKTDAVFTPGQRIRIRFGLQDKGIRMELLPTGDMQPGKEQSAGIGKFQEMSALLDGKAPLGLEEQTTRDVLFSTSLSRARNLSRLFSGKEGALEKIFSALSLKSDVPDKDFLSKLVSFGGLLFEKKMASVLETKGVASFRELLPSIVQQDAKGVALEALRQAVEEDGSSSGRTGFSDTIESVQIVNSHTSESGRYFIPFPIADSQGFRLGQLFVDLGGKQEKDQGKNRKNIKIAFLLDMSKMGHVRADFSILDRAITGRFLFGNAETCAYADSMIPRLKEGLAKAGFHAAGIDCVLATPREINPGVFMDACVEQVGDSDVHVVI